MLNKKILLMALLTILIVPTFVFAATYTYYEYDPYARSLATNITTNCASYGANYFLQNLSAYGGQCQLVNVGSSGTVTSVATGYGLSGGTITTSGTLLVNLTELVNNFGNWSEDKPNYATLSYVQSYVATIGNFSVQQLGLYQNITNLQTSNTSIWSWLNNLYTNVTSLFTSNTSTNQRIDDLNNTKTGLNTATCPTGYYMQNVTTTTGGVTPQCALDTTGGSSGGGINNANSELNFSYNGIMIDEQCGQAGTSGSYAQWYGAAISSGNTGLSDGGTNHPCIRTFATSATASSGYAMTTGSTQMILAGGEIFEIIFNKTTRTAGLNFSIVKYGFLDSATATTPTDAVYVNISNLSLGAYVVNNGVVTASPMINISENKWYKSKIYVVNTTQSVFELYNSTDKMGVGDTNLIWSWTINASIPSAYGRHTGSNYQAYRNGGSVTGETLLEIDYVSLWINRTITR